MAVEGLKMLYFGLKGADGSVLTGADKGLSESGVFELDVDRAKGNLGTKTANIASLSGNITKISANDQVVDMTKGDAAPTVTIDAAAISGAAKQKLLGKVKSASGAWIDGDGIQEAGLIIETHDVVTNKSVFFAFGRGSFSESSQNVGTNTDTAKTREDDQLTFTALSYKNWNNKPFATYYEGDEEFSRQKVFDDVFPGNTYHADGTPADPVGPGKQGAEGKGGN